MVNGRGVLLFHKEKVSVLSSIWLILRKNNVCILGYTHTHDTALNCKKDENSLHQKIKLSSKELWCLTTLYGLINGLCVLNLREMSSWGMLRNCYETQSNGMLILSHAQHTDKTMELHKFQSKDIKDNFIPLTRESSDRSMALT